MDYMICGDKDGNRALSEAEYKNTLGESWEKCVMGRADRRAHGFMRFIEADEDIDDKLSLTELRVALSKLWGPPGEQLRSPSWDVPTRTRTARSASRSFMTRLPCTTRRWGSGRARTRRSSAAWTPR